ncbi:MAG: sulfite exporter TauE/SafE family protein [Lachnospiraceae bacterium]|nr:sulfite exporter TauE/SafE family protein [Lachnospiraceae bacterium]
MSGLFILIVPACLAVGLCIGWCGVAGFLLPILFVSKCGFDSAQSLFLSFSCFLVSGLIGAYNYYRRKELPLGRLKPLLAGSLAGALLGAVIGQIFVSGYIKLVLYIVVLFSGLMIFVQDMLTRGKQTEREKIHPAALFVLGIFTAMICALSGAGGPVIVMPLLVVLGFPIRAAVGTALFDSVFIAIPAILVYGSQADLAGIASAVIPAALLSHAVGIYVGSRTAGHIPQRPLKLGVAAFSVLFALWKLFL